MVAGWICSIEFVVNHVRQPCQGVPVAGMYGRECPENLSASQTGLYMAILCDIYIVIITDKVKMMHLPENDKSYQNKEKGNNEVVTENFMFTHNLPDEWYKLLCLLLFRQKTITLLLIRIYILAGQRLTIAAGSPFGP